MFPSNRTPDGCYQASVELDDRLIIWTQHVGGGILVGLSGQLSLWVHLKNTKWLLPPPCVLLWFVNFLLLWNIIVDVSIIIQCTSLWLKTDRSNRYYVYSSRYACDPSKKVLWLGNFEIYSLKCFNLISKNLYELCASEVWISYLFFSLRHSHIIAIVIFPGMSSILFDSQFVLFFCFDLLSAVRLRLSTESALPNT